ncbi:MAG: YkgJ family cysteine cluster protein [Myxococcales bacterium]|nr:YkgJ family cysteine cluster protein [Myxococcales bacterium]
MLKLTIPEARSDLKLERIENSKGYRVIDTRGAQRVGLDVLSAAILAELDRPITHVKLVNALKQRLGANVRAEHVFRRLHWINQQSLLVGPRSAHYLRRVEAAKFRPKVPENNEHLPFEFVSELRHECQACGGCCSGTDVGPLSAEVVERIRKEDWTQLDGFRDGLPLFRVVHDETGTYTFTSNFKDACAFLQTDRLCAIHSRLGVENKPPICRQFPYLFTKTPAGTLAVSLQTECRAWLKAKSAGTPPEYQQQMLRELLRAGAIVRTVTEPVCVRPGVFLSWDEYMALEGKLLSSLDHHHPIDGGVVAEAHVRECADLVETPFAEFEKFLEPEAWTQFGATTWDYDHADTKRKRDVEAVRQTFLQALNDELDSNAQEFAAAGRQLESMRFVQLKRAIVTALTDHDVLYRRLPASELDEVARDAWRASIFAKDLLRYNSVTVGLAVLRLQICATIAHAMLRARDSSRLHVEPRDAVDSAVLVTKMLRQRSVSAFLRHQSDSVLLLF